MTWTEEHTRECLAKFRNDMRRSNYCAPVESVMTERVMRKLRFMGWTLSEVGDIWNMSKDQVTAYLGHR